MESKILKIIERNLPSLTGISEYERSTFQKILDCRTATVPNLFSRCGNCGTVCPVYKSCKNRLCPICNGAGTVKWIAKRESELLAGNIELKANQIYIDLSPWMGSRNIQAYLEIIKKALQERKLLSFEYADRYGNITARTAELYPYVSR